MSYSVLWSLESSQIFASNSQVSGSSKKHLQDTQQVSRQC